MKTIISLMIMLASFSFSYGQEDATEIIRKANNLLQGETNEMTITMKLIRPKWERVITMKTWGKGTEYSLVLITSPAKDEGQTFLKRGNEMWNWVPSISRMIKLPPSMMSQNWMSSDLSYDDFLKESSIVDDYTHKILKTEEISGMECYKIELMPKEDAAVVWGKVIKWVSKDGYFTLKSEYYDEDMDLVRTEMTGDIKYMGNRRIPTKYVVIPADKPGNQTLMVIDAAKFDIPIADDFFSQQNMKTVE
ncbi:MAG: outer membrane lipoprotein-sorting protein [Marinilabiliales bacterium]|nr:MAG: outer membrane lipoprotein-sorting protein [Marinilabiliales bacterium]